MTRERERAEEFVAALEKRFGEDLLTVLLYGSAARGTYREGSSDLNVLALVASLDSVDLERAEDPTRAWVEQGHPPPLLLSQREWQRSADVFPIEYSDIRDAHILLRGNDPFDGIVIEREHLRLQLEHELRSNKIKLREGFLAYGFSAESAGPLMVQSLSTFMTLFRASLRLAGREIPSSPERTIHEIARMTEFDPDPVLAVLDAKGGFTNGERVLGGDVPAGYLMAIERVASWLDRYEPTEGTPATV